MTRLARTVRHNRSRPVDQPLGVHDNTATCGARRVCCTVEVIHDFEQAAQDLYTAAGIRISAEKLRQLVEQEGRTVLEARLSGSLVPAWSAPEARRAYGGVDGVLVRTVTQDEKQKRRQQHETFREGRERAGMKWNPDNAAAVMNLVALRESGQWNRWWDRLVARCHKMWPHPT